MKVAQQLVKEAWFQHWAECRFLSLLTVHAGICSASQMMEIHKCNNFIKILLYFQAWLWLSTLHPLGLQRQLWLLWLLQRAAWTTRCSDTKQPSFFFLKSSSTLYIREMGWCVTLFFKMVASGVLKNHGEQIGTMTGHTTKNN